MTLEYDENTITQNKLMVNNAIEYSSMFEDDDKTVYANKFYEARYIKKL